MKIDTKAEKIVNILEELYPDPDIPLIHKDPYTLLVAVMLSAQTTDKKVNQVTPKLFNLADSPQKMAGLEVEEIQDAIREVGLAPTKSKNLHKMAKQLLTIFNGIVPNNLESLETLAGVGHKTASVVIIQAFGGVAFPVDTHIHRLAERWGISDGSSVVRTEKDLKQIFNKSLWSKLHLQIIYFGREHCPARNHNLNECIICSWAASKKN